MKKILYVTALGCVLSLGAMGAIAHDNMKEKESGILRASHVLPRQEGEDFRKTMHEADEENAQLVHQIEVDHADIYDILTAPDFDGKAFRAKTKEIRSLQEEEKDNRDEAFTSAVEQLEPKDRMKLAHALEKEMHKPAMHHSRKHAAAMKNRQTEENQNARSGNASEEPAAQ